MNIDEFEKIIQKVCNERQEYLEKIKLLLIEKVKSGQGSEKNIKDSVRINAISEAQDSIFHIKGVLLYELRKGDFS